MMGDPLPRIFFNEIVGEIVLKYFEEVHQQPSIAPNGLERKRHRVLLAAI